MTYEEQGCAVQIISGESGCVKVATTTPGGILGEGAGEQIIGEGASEPIIGE